MDVGSYENSDIATRVIIMSLACSNLAVQPKSPLKEPSIWHALRGKKSRSAKNEKRYIRLYMSSFYKIGELPDNAALMYDTIYTSNVIETSVMSDSDSSDVTPALAAMISHPEGFDCLLRMHVYYSSNLTNGEEILLAGISFSMQAAMMSQGVFAIKEDMYSEHCTGACARIFVMQKTADLFTSTAYAIMNRKSIELNPMIATYAFYKDEEEEMRQKSMSDLNEADFSYSFNRIPAVLCEEYSFEPRLSAKVSLEYLKCARKEWEMATRAWKDRLNYERKRQGWFEDENEAFNNGWYQLRIQVVGAYLDFHGKGKPNMMERQESVFSFFNASNTNKHEQLSFKSIKNNPLYGVAHGLEEGTQFTSLQETLCSQIHIRAETSTDKSYCRNLGRTNVEYNTPVPVYGSNLNADNVSKPELEFNTSDYKSSKHLAQEIRYQMEHSQSEFNLSNKAELKGERVTILSFIPNVPDMCVHMKLCAKGENQNALEPVGDVSIPLENFRDWNRSQTGEVNEFDRNFCVPVTLWEDGSFSGSAQIHVKISVKTPVENFGTDPLPYSVTSLKPNEQVPDKAHILDPNRTYNSCYDWTYVCGDTTKDPLIIEKAESETGTLSTSSLTDYFVGSEGTRGSGMNRLDIHYNTNWLEEHIQLLESALRKSDTDLLDDTTQDGDELSYESKKKEKKKMNAKKKDGKGVPTLISFNELIEECERRWKNDISFRPSAEKKESELQGLPINLIVQVMVFSSLNMKADGKLTRTVDVMSGMTCGSMTDHATKSKQGGIFNTDKILERSLKDIEETKKILQEFMRTGGVVRKTVESLVAGGDHDEVLRRTLNTAEKIERNKVIVGHRRILCLSQGLSTVINGLIVKLNQVADGTIDAETAERWVTHGFLIIFEGLLSVSGKERTMLEDTFATIETLRLFKAKVVQGEVSTTDVKVEGRTVTILLPKSALDSLPNVFRGPGGVEIDLVSVLFTQGIDMVQTIALQTQGKSSTENLNSGDLQKAFNNSSLKVLNSYCHRYPVVYEGSRQTSVGDAKLDNGEPVHPIVHEMYKTIQDFSSARKDVYMLEQMEDVALLLKALRVTFCKSGKDRTGMAVTLEQSRHLQKKYGVGTKEKDMIANANIMREYGTRLDVVEKNIKKRVYAINSIQANFLPEMYKPPVNVLEDLIRNDGDNT